MESEVLLAFIAFMSAVMAGFFKLISDQNKTHATLSNAMNKVASSNQEIAEATKTGSREAKERNGHLAEMALQGQNLTINSKKQIIKAVTNVKRQQVMHQTVGQSTVMDETVEHETVTSKE